MSKVSAKLRDTLGALPCVPCLNGAARETIAGGKVPGNAVINID